MKYTLISKITGKNIKQISKKQALNLIGQRYPHPKCLLYTATRLFSRFVSLKDTIILID